MPRVDNGFVKWRVLLWGMLPLLALKTEASTPMEVAYTVHSKADIVSKSESVHTSVRVEDKIGEDSLEVELATLTGLVSTENNSPTPDTGKGVLVGVTLIVLLLAGIFRRKITYWFRQAFKV